VRIRLDKLRKIDWKNLREDKKLKFNIGLAVVMIVSLILLIDVVYSIHNFKFVAEKLPPSTSLRIEPSKPSAILKVKPANPPVGLKRSAEKPPEHKQEPFDKLRAKEAQKKKEPVKVSMKLKLPFFHRHEKPGKVAIILDDAGGNLPDYKEIYSIKLPLTISIIPNLPDSRKVAVDAKAAGLEVMLHVPMESENSSLTWKNFGMIKTVSSSDEIKKVMLEGLDNVKLASGFNNHMGSKATSDEKTMREVFSSLQNKDLYFVDSKTSAGSVAAKVSRSFGIRTGENDMFLDGAANEAEISKRLMALISIARRKGAAIGIGHATRPATIAVLKREMPVYAKEGIQFVHASELVK
jgi:uncharacterized protein